MTITDQKSPAKTTESPDHLRLGSVLRFATITSWVIVALMIVESLLGFLVEGIYLEEPWAVASFRGNDLVTLVLVVPLLALGVAWARRSIAWTLVWVGGLLYGTYNFAYYTFGSQFNDVFLLHVASFALSMVALIALASSIDAPTVAAAFGGRGPRRTVAGYMIFIGAALVLAWGGLALRFAITGELPANHMPDSAVHLVYAIDMGLLAPMFLGGGILLWRNAPWGWILGVAVNVFGAFYLVVLEFVGGFQAEEGIGETTWLSMPAIGGAILCTIAVVLLLRGLNEPTA